jgi:hypothetical protein
VHQTGVVVEFELPAPTVNELLGRVDKLLSTLIDSGYGPMATSVATPENPSAPLCPIHKKPMKQSQYGGWFCPQKVADDDGSGKPVYCKATA